MSKAKLASFVLLLAGVAVGFQNCAKSVDLAKQDVSSSAGPSPGIQPGNPTASTIPDVSVVPGESATIGISLNALPPADLVYTYSTIDDTATAGTQYVAVQNGNGGIFAGSATAQIVINTTNTAAVSYYGKSFKVDVRFPSNSALDRVVRVSFSAAPTGSALKNLWAGFPSSTLAPTPRFYHSAVWTGTNMIVVGGFVTGSVLQNNGKSYDPATNTWVDINMTGGPGLRGSHTAIWTGSKMIVWGGRIDASGTPTNTGMSYDPSTNLWTAISTTGAPSARWGHVAVWTGSKMIVWGGVTAAGELGDGGVYDPVTNTWAPMTATGAPSARGYLTAVWTGSKMVVWGGYNGTILGDGKSYDPMSNTWTDISATGAPAARYVHSAVWTGSKMIVWGGYNGAEMASGGIYDPSTNSWSTLNVTGSPRARHGQTVVWTGASALYWGGYDNVSSSAFGDGGIYY